MSLVAIIAVGALLLAACSDDDGSAPPSDTEPVEEQESTTTAPAAEEAPPEDPAPEANLEGVQVGLEEVTRLERPVSFAPRSGTEDVFVAEQPGRVRQLIGEHDEDSDRIEYELEDTPLLDIADEVASEGEQGLLGLAFSSDGRQLYVHYTDVDGNTNLDEYDMTEDGVDEGSRHRVFFTEQPAGNHNGGQLTFGPDGYLYLALGDGGGAGDPEGNGQDPTTVLGSILRIDPDGRTGDQPYAVPDDNPFADSDDGAAEVWAYGLRNPWRFSFDAATDDLWIADVGQNEVEEINWLPAETNGGRGANLGWPILEGTEPYSGDEPPGDLVDPIYEYSRDDGACSITGGYVYRGTAIEGLHGAYVFADLCLPEIRALLTDGGDVQDEREVGTGLPRATAFGQDNHNELWALSHEGGVYRLVSG